MIHPLIKSSIHSFVIGVSFCIGVIATSAIAVTVSTTFSSGEKLTATSLNALKTAIENVPNWTKGTNTSDAVYTEGNVGIGTTTPQNELDVNGNIKSSNLAGSGQRCVAVDSNGVLIAKTSDCGTLTSGDDLGSHTASQNIQLNNFRISNDGDDEGIAISNLGDVGIGTTSPSSKLDVSGTIRAQQLCDENGSNCKDISSGWSSGGSGAFTDASGKAYYTGGNVGIGTTTPASKLDVSGAIRAQQLCDENGSNCKDISSGWSSGGSGSGAFTDASGKAYYTGGNVGIGTTTPETTLHVKATSGSTLRLSGSLNDKGLTLGGDWPYIDSFGTGARLLLNFGSSQDIDIGSGDLYVVNSAGTVGIGTKTPNGKFHVNGAGDYDNNASAADDVVITTQGKVGIGTRSPASKLDVSGTIRAEELCDESGSNCKDISSGWSSGGSGAFTDTGSLAYYTGGNVGIGTTSPAYKLDVSGVIKATGLYAAAGQSLELKSLNHTGSSGDGGAVTIGSGHASTVSGGSGGNITIIAGSNNASGGAGYGGLGTTGKIEIKGATGTNSVGGNVNITAGGSSYWAQGTVHSDVVLKGGSGDISSGGGDSVAKLTVEGGYVGNGQGSKATGGNLILQAGTGVGSGVDGTIQLLNGNVGVGTASPSYLLHVNGTAAGTSWTNLSSAEYKKNIKRVDNSEYSKMLDHLMKMELSTYQYKKEYGSDNTTKLGFIAEEMPKEVLTKDGKGVDLYELLAYTIGAMKAQQKALILQQKQNRELMARIDRLEKAQ